MKLLAVAAALAHCSLAVSLQHSFNQPGQLAGTESVHVVSRECWSLLEAGSKGARVAGVIGSEDYWILRGDIVAAVQSGGDVCALGSGVHHVGHASVDAPLLLVLAAVEHTEVASKCGRAMTWLAQELQLPRLSYPISLATTSSKTTSTTSGDATSALDECMHAVEQEKMYAVRVSDEAVAPGRFEAWQSVSSTQRSARIHDLVQSVGNSTSRVQYFATYLTGENAASPIVTRQSYSDSGKVAAQWIKDQLTAMGFETSFHTYNRYTNGRQWNPNVVAEWPGNADGGDANKEIVIIGAHYDDRQFDVRSTSARAPGANDDGSGTTLVLQLAEWISTRKLKFNTRVILMAYSGEEQGLCGSDAWAREAKQKKLPIRAMLQADMVGYNYRQGVELGLAFVEGYTTPTLTSRVREWTKQYVPELVISRTNACCSDHQSFYTHGYPSAGFVEAKGYTVDPEYHHPGDLVKRPGYDLDQILFISKAMLASLCELAELQ